MGVIASQITSHMIIYSIFYSDADHRKYQSSASLAFVRGIHQGPVNSPHKWPVTRKMFPFDDVTMWQFFFFCNGFSETCAELLAIFVCASIWTKYLVLKSHYNMANLLRWNQKTSLIARFMGPTWCPPGADRTQVGPMLAPWTLLSGLIWYTGHLFRYRVIIKKGQSQGYLYLGLLVLMATFSKYHNRLNKVLLYMFVILASIAKITDKGKNYYS